MGFVCIVSVRKLVLILHSHGFISHRPPELCRVTKLGADLIPLMDIARVSNKYSFKTLELWALDTLESHVNRKPPAIAVAFPPPVPPHIYAHNTTPLEITKLVRLAQLCGHDSLLNTMISLLRARMVGSLQYAHLAMSLADELDLRPLRGAAYLEVMQKANVLQPAPPGSSGGEIDDDGKLLVNQNQRLRLLQGYFHLTRVWERLRTNPPKFDHSSSCGATWHQHGCTQSWLEFWKEKVKSDECLSLGPADVLGRLKQVQKDFDRWGSATYMHHDCKVAAKRAMHATVKNVEGSLSDYFTVEGLED